MVPNLSDWGALIPGSKTHGGKVETLNMAMKTMTEGTTSYVAVDRTRTPEGIRVGRGAIVPLELHSYVEL